MAGIKEWLQGLGLGEYAGVFEMERVDRDALPDLTEDDLKDMGLPIGPRRKILKAIDALRSGTYPQPGTEREPATPPSPAVEAERRQITVMFCDMVGSTSLAQQLDPEDLRALMHGYQRACGAVVERYDGHVAQYLGDGVMAYFGWPKAHEDDAVRGVKAGLDIVKAVKTVQAPRPLSVRVGICTGVVVISQTGHGDPSKPLAAVGETPAIASRLQSIAPTDAVVIAESTSRLVSGHFDQEDLGPQQLKGVAEPVHAFRIRGVEESATRFDAAHPMPLARLVGRDSELALLLQRWHDATAGEGQVFLLSGVPGVGKSRLVRELEERIGQEPHYSLQLQCSPHHGQSALFPIIEQIERVSRIGVDDASDVKLDKLEQWLSRATGQVDKAVPFIAELLSVPVGSRYPPLALTSQQVKDQTLFVLVELLHAMAARQPVFCLVEDAQWLDPSTQEFLDLAISQIDQARILLVVTHRPEYQTPWRARGNVSAYSLTRLRRGDVAEMVALAAAGRAVLGPVMERIIEGSDCIPLFVEELTRGAIEAGIISERVNNDGLAEPVNFLSVPATLRDSLMARLDRVPQGLTVAQTAAVVGREFSYDLLLRVMTLSKDELDSTLARLEQGEIVQQIIRRPPARYAFRHALLRDAAYESLLKSSRRQIHARVATIIEQDSADTVAGRPELLAYHYSQAGNAEFAVRYWLQGGRRALSRSAYLEAIGQFRKALEFLAFLPETRERGATELEVQLSLGMCCIAVHGYAADDTRESFERASALSAELGESAKEIQAIFGLWGHYWMRARHDSAIELSETLLAKAQALGDPVPLVVAYRTLGSTLFTLGEFVRARQHLEQAIALSRDANHEELSSAYAVDPGIASRLLLAWDLWILGYPAHALDTVEQALGEATEHAHPYGIAFAHYVTSAVHLLRGEPEESLVHAERSLAISREHRINLYALYSQFGRGCALAQLGRTEEGLAEIAAGIEQARRSNLGYLRGFMLGWLAVAQSHSTDTEAALATVDEALAGVDDVTGRAWEAELHRLRGEFLRVAPGSMPADAEASFRAALAVARRQQARGLELRAACSLARLWRSEGRFAEARDLLAPVHASFTEGLDTRDLIEAKAVLDELGAE